MAHTLAVWATAVSSSAYGAQDVIEEIVVTALKREQAALDLPASITVLSRDQLTERGTNNVRDIQWLVPSMQVGEFASEQIIAIRGIQSFNRSPGVAVSVDGVYQSRTNLSPLNQLDLDRVEVQVVVVLDERPHERPAAVEAAR